MTYDRAARFIASHGFAVRPSAKADHIEAEMLFGDGTAAWEMVRLDATAIRDWLGY